LESYIVWLDKATVTELPKLFEISDAEEEDKLPFEEAMQ
jgi:hypothetical protein